MLRGVENAVTSVCVWWDAGWGFGTANRASFWPIHTVLFLNLCTLIMLRCSEKAVTSVCVCVCVFVVGQRLGFCTADRASF